MNFGAAASAGLWAARARPAPAAVERPAGAFSYTRMHIGNAVNAPGKWVSNFVVQQRTRYAGAVGAAVGVPVVAPAVTLEQMAALRQARDDYNEAQQRRRDDSTPHYYPTEEMLARPRALEPHVAAAHARVMAQKVEAQQLAADLLKHHEEQRAREQAYARGQPYYVPHGVVPRPQQPPPPTRPVPQSPW
jgi:hypothetical protein